MATRSTISIKEDGKIRTIYSHWDGYPSNNGKVLKEHYNDVKKIKELIALGDISTLAPNIKPVGKTGTKMIWEGAERVSVETTEPHTFDKPWAGVTIAYGRDRGETGIEPKEYTNEKSISGEEYDYLFKNDEWYVRGTTASGSFVKLTDKIIENY